MNLEKSAGAGACRCACVDKKREPHWYIKYTRVVLFSP